MFDTGEPSETEPLALTRSISDDGRRINRRPEILQEQPQGSFVTGDG